MSENHGGQFPPHQQWSQQQQQWPQQQGWPQQPPKKKGLSTKLKVLLLVGALVVVGGGIGLIFVLKAAVGPEKQAKGLTEGDCVVLTGSGKEADAAKTSCDSPQAPYAVSLTGVAKGDWNCKDGFYQYTVPRPGRGDGVALCLAINAKVGLCFDDIESKTPPPLKDCGSARLRISEVFPQMSVVNSPCAEGTAEVISYASYGTSNFKSATICFVKP
ncbi:hypothetical protein [Amycolatopsis sp. BJA-103]|uniref:LppU/SCO3897 family protein n=1 Tax=unclassified Amycolatopsis TaxID=2618356 RepID=UPI000C78E3F1|nr:hypothetical protein [Amycolatopsis sp. BJA-103]AUI63628.1 hypothetical protein BKN51_39380 [Amycolatopsis sp. BJA-103]PNE19471.1 hypothetical protein B1H26_17095 [Amycolatopsis sp. BJA-103]